MAFQIHTSALFDPLPVDTVLLAVTMIAHCIWEYESGEHRIEKFEGPKVTGRCYGCCRLKE